MCVYWAILFCLLWLLPHLADAWLVLGKCDPCASKAIVSIFKMGFVVHRNVSRFKRSSVSPVQHLREHFSLFPKQIRLLIHASSGFRDFAAKVLVSRAGLHSLIIRRSAYKVLCCACGVLCEWVKIVLSPRAAKISVDNKTPNLWSVSCLFVLACVTFQSCIVFVYCLVFAALILARKSLWMSAFREFIVLCALTNTAAFIYSENILYR